MAKRELLVCDGDNGSCQQEAVSFILWQEGAKQAWSVDLCPEHAQPLLDLVENAQLVNLPTRQRVRMEVTPLKATEKTRHLKKRTSAKESPSIRSEQANKT